MTTRLRNIHKEDRSGLAGLLAGIPSFDSEDQAVALELVDIALENAEQSDYLFVLAADDQDRPIGYACYGPTPLTEGTYDMYWIAVSADLAGKGVGTSLLRAVEEDLRKRNGRMLIIETSSSEAYDKTRQFYLKNGYPLTETIKDFYRPGEDRVTFIKRLD